MPRHHWSTSDEEVLRRTYPTCSTSNIARSFGITVSQVQRKANSLGLHKTPEYLSTQARASVQAPGHGAQKTQFRKGIVPANKGLRRPGYAPGETHKTQFKAGNRPHTWRPIGTHVINSDGYLDRKVTDEGAARHHKWKPVHVLVWQEAHGPAPAGHVVTFRPGMFTNVLDLITLDRLELVTRAELMRRNSIQNYPEPIRQAMRLRGQITRAIASAQEQQT